MSGKGCLLHRQLGLYYTTVLDDLYYVWWNFLITYLQDDVIGRYFTIYLGHV